MQALVDQHTNRLTLTQSTFASVEEAAPVEQRLRYLHSIIYPAQWEIKRELAEHYMSLGVTLSAAELFQELELWDEVVICYKIASKINKAKALVEERLQICETPEMRAALGDLTCDPSHWARAWELSNSRSVPMSHRRSRPNISTPDNFCLRQRYARAKSSLGKWAFQQGRLEECATHLEAAVEVKPLDKHSWFLLGSTRMRLGRLKPALTAFSHVVQCDPQEKSAWGNIAAIHMKLDNNASAYSALKEALKENHENWRLWENLLIVTIDLAKFGEAMYCMGQLLDAREQSGHAVDTAALSLVVIGVLQDAGKGLQQGPDTSADEAPKMHPDVAQRQLEQLGQLLARFTATTKSDPSLWECAAVFNIATGKYTQARECRMKQCRAIQNTRHWERDEQQVKKMISAASSLCSMTFEAGDADALYACRMLLKGLLPHVGDHETAAAKLAGLVAQIDEREGG